ncbi:MAG TPA: NAD(P)/FAD-dependent oxidoreductase [Bdellovibrionales bacterium]|nr:NAD(P)/FAD-dependent oxidoreductase [Bdellovibrionales bacterium]
MKTDVLILGSGISALTAGVLLARKGKKVTLLEQYNKPGGYMHSFRRMGETFDTGAHYFGALGPGQPFRVLLEYLGVFDEKIFAPLNPSGFDVLCYPEGRVLIPQGHANAVSELAAIFPNERAAIARYFELIEKTSACFPTYRFNDAPESSFPPEALDLSLRDIVEGLTNDPRLRSVFYSYCTLHGVDPRDVAFGFHAIVTDSLIRGPYGLNGGGDELTRAFVNRLEALGGQVKLRRKVTAIETEGRQAKRVVCANGEAYSAEWVISSIHPKATFRMVSDQSLFPPVFKDRLRGLKESGGIFGMYTTSRRRPPTDPSRNYYFFRSSDPDDIFAATNPGETPPVVFVSSPKRSWSAEETHFPMSLHATGPYEWFLPFQGQAYGRRSADYKNLKARISDSVFRAVGRYEPDLPAHIAETQSSTPLTHLHFNGSEEGSSYGLYHSMQNTGARALGPRTKVLNLLLTGQNCLFPGLLGAATSALRTCGHITGIKPILQELKKMGDR